MADDPERAEFVRAVLDRQAAMAKEMMKDLKRWRGLIAEIESARRAPLITIPLRLETLPADIKPLRFDRGKYQAVRAGEGGEHVIYPDVLDGMVEAWVEQAASALRVLMGIGGYKDDQAMSYLRGLKRSLAADALAAQIGEYLDSGS